MATTVRLPLDDNPLEKRTRILAIAITAAR